MARTRLGQHPRPGGTGRIYDFHLGAIPLAVGPDGNPRCGGSRFYLGSQKVEECLQQEPSITEEAGRGQFRHLQLYIFFSSPPFQQAQGLAQRLRQVNLTRLGHQGAFGQSPRLEVIDAMEESFQLAVDRLQRLTMLSAQGRLAEQGFYRQLNGYYRQLKPSHKMISCWHLR